MAWIRPTSHTANGWTTPDNAYDGDTDTKAEYAIGANTWSPYLEMFLTSAEVSQIRVYTSRQNTQISGVQFDIYYSDDWHNIYDDEPSTNGASTTVDVDPARDITGVRVRFYRTGTGGTRWAAIHDTELYEVETPVIIGEAIYTTIGDIEVSGRTIVAHEVILTSIADIEIIGIKITLGNYENEVISDIVIIGNKNSTSLFGLEDETDIEIKGNKQIDGQSEFELFSDLEIKGYQESSHELSLTSISELLVEGIKSITGYLEIIATFDIILDHVKSTESELDITIESLVEAEGSSILDINGECQLNSTCELESDGNKRSLSEVDYFSLSSLLFEGIKNSNNESSFGLLSEQEVDGEKLAEGETELGLESEINFQSIITLNINGDSQFNISSIISLEGNKNVNGLVEVEATSEISVLPESILHRNGFIVERSITGGEWEFFAFTEDDPFTLYEEEELLQEDVEYCYRAKRINEFTDQESEWSNVDCVNYSIIEEHFQGETSLEAKVSLVTKGFKNRSVDIELIVVTGLEINGIKVLRGLSEFVLEADISSQGYQIASHETSLYVTGECVVEGYKTVTGVVEFVAESSIDNLGSKQSSDDTVLDLVSEIDISGIKFEEQLEEGLAEYTVTSNIEVLGFKNINFIIELNIVGYLPLINSGIRKTSPAQLISVEQNYNKIKLTWL